MPNTPTRHRMPITVGNQVEAVVVTWDDGGRGINLETTLATDTAMRAALSGALQRIEQLWADCQSMKQSRSLKVKQVLRDAKNQIIAVTEEDVLI